MSLFNYNKEKKKSGTFKFIYKNNHQKTTLTNIHRKVLDFLLDRKIPVDVEKDFPPYQADIYIPSKNIIVECDGNRWHNGRKGNEHDRVRDKVLIEKYKVKRVIRILGTDIANNYKLKLIIDGIEQDNLIDNIKRNDQVILMIKDKNYKGVIIKSNKFSYTIYVKSLKKNLTMDKHGLVSYNKGWFRCVKMNKTTSLPIWLTSIARKFEEAIKDKSLDDAQEIFRDTKEFLERKKYG